GGGQGGGGGGGAGGGWPGVWGGGGADCTRQRAATADFFEPRRRIGRSTGRAASRALGERRLRQRTVQQPLWRGDRREREHLRRGEGGRTHPEVRCERYLPHHVGGQRLRRRTVQLPLWRGDRRERARERRGWVDSLLP